jgi:hypothetical protein
MMMMMMMIGIDYVGEGLAAMLGITTPKYQYIIDELIEEQERVRGMDGWWLICSPDALFELWWFETQIYEGSHSFLSSMNFMVMIRIIVRMIVKNNRQ